ncbi:maleylpyruvate isomerase family mycothiol-dependent enzyme [Actinoplanes flavus]|uniref:Maleylpyruvate isomerase family mycothiol-dependent enzyme n=1 Tax=Actinoplanes flavus TaxID=2820290 RepID=A0ABS3UIT3_9ACTN|nr:maleylpyruvate isomerase family mycothiol-dependent enzyme [Actinoplanes flavus]MBO3738699.1 maleylpyruvate isomerase family mycothiol-dependent enzyme [Actinoplanes flavus]
MSQILEFPHLIHLLDERTEAFRAAVAAAPDLGAPVPTCPDWTLFDLAQHMGEGRRRWAATIAAGPADTRPDPSLWESETPREREALLFWLDESARVFADALAQAGPDRGCWTWWGVSASPQTAGAVGRHQLQEVAVHTYDAQLAAGAPQPLPAEVALDGVDEFLATCCAGPYRWPHQPVAVDYQAAEGRTWRLTLAADGVRVGPPTDEPAGATLRGTASELVLALYGRIPVTDLKIDGDAGVFDLLLAWDPEE